MLLPGLVAAGSGEAAVALPPMLFASHHEITTNLTTYNFTGVGVGVAHANRRVFFVIGWSSTTSRTVSSVTVGGNAATVLPGGSATSGGYALAWIDLPAGSTTTVDVVFSGGTSNCALQVFYTQEADLFLQGAVPYGPSASSSINTEEVPIAPDDALLITAANYAGASGNSLTWAGVGESPSADVNVEASFNLLTYLLVNRARSVAAAVFSGSNSNKGAFPVSFGVINPAGKVKETGWWWSNSIAGTITGTGQGFGKPDASRIIIVALDWTTTAGNPTLTSITIGGVGATIVAQTNANNCGAAIAYASVPTGEFGDVAVTMSSTTHHRSWRVFAAYPATATPLDSVSNGVASATSVALSDLEIASGGFAIIAYSQSGTGADEDATAAWSGTDLPVKVWSRTPTTTRRHFSWMMKTAANDNTLDMTISSASALARRAVAASWV